MNNNEAVEVTKKLMVLLNKDQNLVKEYIKRFGLTIDGKNIKEIKSGTRSHPTAPNPALAARQAKINEINAANAAAAAAVAKRPQPQGADAGAEGGEADPVFETFVNCPVCGQTEITGYEMRAKSQQVVQTPFLVPIYTGASGYKTVDYTLLAVTVCPKCLFASPDKRNFNYLSFTGNSEEKSTLLAGVLITLKDKMEERKALLPEAVGNAAYFKRERSPKVAIESYRLAMARAEAEAELMQPYGYFKLGSYALKIAHIMKCNGEDDTETLKEAVGYFEKSFAKSECQSDELEMQVVYLIVTLFVRLGDFNQGNSYLSVFGKLMTERQEAMKKNPSLNTHWIEQWQDKSRFIWEERENPEIFNKYK